MKVIGNHESTKGILTPRFKKKKKNKVYYLSKQFFVPRSIYKGD